MTHHPDAAFWNRFAPRYARARIADPGGYERTVARTAAILRPADRVLEVGCGTGSTALRLAGGVTAYLGTDVAPGMIAIAEGKRAAAAGATGLAFAVAPAGALPPGAEGPFDAVLAFNLLHLVRDLPGTLGRLRGALVPGGVFVSKTPCLGEMSPVVAHGLLPLMRLARLAPAVTVLNEAALVRAIGAAGFAVEAVERHATRGRDTRPFILARAT